MARRPTTQLILAAMADDASRVRELLAHHRFTIDEQLDAMFPAITCNATRALLPFLDIGRKALAKALDHAIDKGNSGAVRLLLRSGCRPDRVSVQTAFARATESLHGPAVLDALIEHSHLMAHGDAEALQQLVLGSDSFMVRGLRQRLLLRQVTELTVDTGPQLEPP